MKAQDSPRRTAPLRPRAKRDEVDVRPPSGLSLAVTRQGIGLELVGDETPRALAPTRALITLPSLKFPIDLSGGVARFRHRRGVLVALAARGSRELLSAEITRRVRALFPKCRVTLIPETEGALVGLDAGAVALAFRVLWAPDGSRPRLVIRDARGLGLAAPAHAVALQVFGLAVDDRASRSGSLFVFENAAADLLAGPLLDAGARLPETDGLAWGPLVAHAEHWEIEAETDGAQVGLSGEATASLELATLLRSADDALFGASLDEARGRYLAALERAPHHPEIARRLAEVDRAIGDRPEAAVTTLMLGLPLLEAGPLGGELLAAVGDRDGARAAFERAGETEPFSALAAACLGRAAALSDSPGEASSFLAAAVARAPSSIALRRQRFAILLDLGDERGARGEAEHIEAITDVDDRHDVLIGLGRAFAEHDRHNDAKRTFERALRLRPRSETAVLSLGIALSKAGQPTRAAEVLARAVALADGKKAPSDEASLALAEVLGEHGIDVPLAIARAKQVAPGHRLEAAARRLEGRYLARLGDRTEASIAYAKLLGAVERAPEQAPAEAADWLFEAAAFERDERDDAELEKRHLGLAIRLRPRDRVLLAAFRKAANEVERRRTAARAPIIEPTSFRLPEPEDPPTREPITIAPPARAAMPMVSFDEDEADDAPAAEVGDSARADKLLLRVQANPEDDDAVLELLAVLARLGRDREAFALVNGRWEDADDDARARLKAPRNAVLARLEAQARAEGNGSEAGLYAALRSD